MSKEDLARRAGALAGLTVAELAARVGREVPSGGVHGKGRVGELVELALGASGGSGRSVDFPSLGVELKTIPVHPAPRARVPHESTFVCAVDLNEEVDWDDAWVRTKLRAVLFVPIEGAQRSPSGARRIGEAVLWTPTPAQDAVLRGDYDDIMGLVGVGRIEDVTAHLGRYLQLRPKASDGRARTVTLGPEGERIRTVPRGFYLRASFTAALLSDPSALP